MSPAIAPVKARPLQLNPDGTAEDAFVAIIGGCLQHAGANLPAVRDGQVEGVHQMRVAFRRLRSALKLFRSRVPRAASAELLDDLRWLNGFLGPARDWDVFLEEGLSVLFEHFPRKRGLLLFRTKAETIRRTHRRALRKALDEPRYPALMRRFSEWLETRAWREMLDDEPRQALAEPVLAFSTPLLDKGHRRVVKRGEDFAKLSAEARHALRIRIKELRYAMDFFASLYPGATVRAYLAPLGELQDSLGIMNDAAVAHRLLDEASLTSASAARQVIEGWTGCRMAAQKELFDALWQRFMACERPWKD